MMATMNSEKNGLLVTTCQVCGEALEPPIRRCPECDTAHHEDCWEYNQGCSTYACKGSFSMGQVAEANDHPQWNVEEFVPLLPLENPHFRSLYILLHWLIWAITFGIGTVGSISLLELLGLSKMWFAGLGPMLCLGAIAFAAESLQPPKPSVIESIDEVINWSSKALQLIFVSIFFPAATVLFLGESAFASSSATAVFLVFTYALLALFRRLPKVLLGPPKGPSKNAVIEKGELLP